MGSIAVIVGGWILMMSVDRQKEWTWPDMDYLNENDISPNDQTVQCVEKYNDDINKDYCDCQTYENLLQWEGSFMWALLESSEKSHQGFLFKFPLGPISIILKSQHTPVQSSKMTSLLLCSEIIETCSWPTYSLLINLNMIYIYILIFHHSWVMQ